MAENISPVQETPSDDVEYAEAKALFKTELRREITRKLRIPFERILADYLGESPSLRAIKALAEKSPDRWIQGAVMLAQLAGYTKDLNINVNQTINISGMSDSQIEMRKLELQKAEKAIVESRRLSCQPVAKPQVNQDDIVDVDYQDNPSSE